MSEDTDSGSMEIYCQGLGIEVVATVYKLLDTKKFERFLSQQLGT